ncbi:hypothetical protein N9L94_03130 [Robiginitalea sp.]|jgi:uncharacterized protein YciI|nr:hypothetical protein [Robiginitalea sp.]
MERHKIMISLLAVVFIVSACNSGSKNQPESADATTTDVENSLLNLRTRNELAGEGFELFEYADPVSGDTILMQQYFIAFLKSGKIRSQNQQEADSLQALHMAHLQRMYDLGYADISGPFGDNGNIRGITIYNVPTLSMADSLANLDPSVRAGRLEIEIHPWWAAKGFCLR